MVYNNLKSLKQKVEYILDRHEATRNSDILLTVKIWEQFYAAHLRKLKADLGRVDDNVYSISKLVYETLLDVPREDNIKRIRASIQNDPKRATSQRYLPTSREVAIQRGFNEQEWRKLLGFNPELRQPV